MGWLWGSSNGSASEESASLPANTFDSSQSPTQPLPAYHDNEMTDPAPKDPELPTTQDQISPELQDLLSAIRAGTPSDKTVRHNDTSEFPQDFSPRDPKTITPMSLYPKEMSCRAAFDQAFYCQSLGGHFNNVYRYGSFRDCKDLWKSWYFCVRTNRGFISPQEREKRIMHHYWLRDAKYRKGGSSEDVWEPRTRMVDDAFNGDLEAAERADREELEQRQKLSGQEELPRATDPQNWQ